MLSMTFKRGAQYDAKKSGAQSDIVQPREIRLKKVN